MWKTRLIACHLLALIPLANPAAASEPHTNKSEIILVAGVAMAAGGMPQADFTALNVCDPQKLDTARVATILGAALSSVRLSLDPATSESYHRLELGATWKTTSALIAKRAIEEYNNTNRDEALPTNLKLYFGFDEGSLAVDGSLLTLFTRTSLVTGSSSQNLESYIGDWNSGYFHDMLRSAFAKGLTDYGCSAGK